jgi:hypothetical protein
MRARALASLVALAAATAGLLPAGIAHAELPVPPLRGRVNDLAGTLDPDVAARLEGRLADFERETTHQIAVLTIPSLEGEPIEPFALRVAEAWRLGQAGVDNGILLVVAPRDRRARIEVGYGLEGVVPDAIAAPASRRAWARSCRRHVARWWTCRRSGRQRVRAPRTRTRSPWSSSRCCSAPYWPRPCGAPGRWPRS